MHTVRTFIRAPAVGPADPKSASSPNRGCARGFFVEGDSMKMPATREEINVSLVSQLVAEQFPQWADLDQAGRI